MRACGLMAGLLRVGVVAGVVCGLGAGGAGRVAAQGLPMPVTGGVAERSAALNSLLKDVWEDELKRHPEFASAIGDRRYNDQLRDLSARAWNDELGRRRVFLTRLLVIDTTGLSEQEKAAAEAMERELTRDEEDAKLKAWETPVNQAGGVHTEFPGLVETVPFETVKDYDDWIARLKKMPGSLRQAIEDMMAGMDEGRVQPASVLELVKTQTDAVYAKGPEESAFAEPLKRFPASFSDADKQRITAATLDAIQNEVYPAYARFSGFLTAQAIPAGGKGEAAKTGMVPGYTVREIRILELRAKAKAAMGAKFDWKGFHDVVATAYTLPMDGVETRVNAWIAGSK